MGASKNSVRSKEYIPVICGSIIWNEVAILNDDVAFCSLEESNYSLPKRSVNLKRKM